MPGDQEGRAEAATPRDASTVILLRDAPDGGLLVYLLRRVSSMKFAPGAYVFPGGSVDPRDADLSVTWSGPSAAEWGTAFGAAEGLARELVSAAVRETFEESGVLLAGPAEHAIVADTSGDDWEADRQALLDRSLSLAELLARRGLVLRGDLLRPWAHWITPEIETRRYDTRFFVAALPAGQRTRDVSTESDRVTWARPDEAAAAAPARRHADAAADAGHADRAGRATTPSPRSSPRARAIRPLMPRARVTDGGVFLEAAGGGEMSIDGGRTDRTLCLLAPNPSPMTLDGTNTWILREPGAERSIVIDPGPEHEEHLRPGRRRGRPGRAPSCSPTATPTTREGARRFTELVGGDVPVRALDPAYRLGDEGLGEGDVVELDGLEVRVMETPGHSARLAELLAARRRGDPHRRHRARLRHDGRPPARATTWRPSTGCAPWPMAPGVILPGHGPRPRRPGRRARLLHRPPPRAPRTGRGGPRRRRPYGRRGRGAGVRRRRPVAVAGRRVVRPGAARLPRERSASPSGSACGGGRCRGPVRRGPRCAASRAGRSRPGPC